MKLLFISSLLVAATNAADVDRRRINGITFADQAVEALNIVHKGQSTTEQKLVATRKGDDNKSDKDDKSSDKSSKSSRSSKSSSTSGDGSRRTDRCFRACDTDRCTSDDRRRLECPASTAASSDFVQKGQASASPIQKLVWAAKKGDEGEDSEGGDETDSKKSSDENRNGNSKSSSSKSKSSSSSGNSGDNDRKWSGSGDDICKDAPKDWCEGSSADGDDKCDDACDKDSDIRCTKDERKHLGCDATSKDVTAVKKLRRRRA